MGSGSDGIKQPFGRSPLSDAVKLAFILLVNEVYHNPTGLMEVSIIVEDEAQALVECD